LLAAVNLAIDLAALRVRAIGCVDIDNSVIEWTTP
jgi:hypothetical protein